MRSLFLIAIVTGLLALGASSAQAQKYTLDRTVMATGGARLSGGPYSLTATIGQLDAGSISGGIYEVDGGFWSLNIAFSPFLAITNTGGNVTITWPTSITGYRLQVTPVLGNTANWQTVSGVANNSVSQPIVAGSRFYRLISP